MLALPTVRLETPFYTEQPPGSASYPFRLHVPTVQPTVGPTSCHTIYAMHKLVKPVVTVLKILPTLTLSKKPAGLFRWLVDCTELIIIVYLTGERLDDRLLESNIILPTGKSRLHDPTVEKTVVCSTAAPCKGLQETHIALRLSRVIPPNDNFPKIFTTGLPNCDLTQSETVFMRTVKVGEIRNVDYCRHIFRVWRVVFFSIYILMSSFQFED